MLNSQVSGVAIQLRLRYSQSLKPWELQKPIPNHQSSFCWICLPLLTLSILRSSCPSSHHWDSTSLVWILSHWSVFRGGLGRGGIQSTSIGHWGSPGIGSWTPTFLHIHYITGSHHTGTWLLLPFLRWWHTALSLISTRWSNGSCTDLRLLGRDERTSPTAQPGKDWASCLHCHSNSTAWLHDSVRFINNYPVSFGQKSSMTSWPSKSTLQRLLDLAGLHFTTSERSGPFWQSMLHNFLSRPLSFLGWTTAMLFWLDFHQTQSNRYKWFRIQRHDWYSTSPKEHMLHLSLSPCTGSQLQLASSSRRWCLHIEQPQAQHPPTSTHYYESSNSNSKYKEYLCHSNMYIQCSCNARRKQDTCLVSSLFFLQTFLFKGKKALYYFYIDPHLVFDHWNCEQFSQISLDPNHIGL